MAKAERAAASSKLLLAAGVEVVPVSAIPNLLAPC